MFAAFTRPHVLLLASVVALGAWLWVGAKPFTPEPLPPTPADEFAVSGPFTHGNLTVFLLHGPDAERSRPVLGLDEALARKCAIVHETGEVGELAVENTSEEDDLLLLSGDMVKGGRQDRVLQATMILPPKSGKVPVRSFCVEQSRWTKRGIEDDTRFAENRGVIAGASLKKAVQVAGNQGEVWENVAVQQAGLSKNVGTVVNSKESPTSLQLALENDKVQAEVAKFRESIAKQVGDPTGVVGFVTVVNGKVTGAEAFGSHTLFRKAWAKSVNAAAVEAVAEKPTRPFSQMTPEGVKTFLANVGREQRETENDRLTAQMEFLTSTRDVPVRGVLEYAESVPAADVTVVNNLVEPVLRRLDLPSVPATARQADPSDPVRVDTFQSVRNQGREIFDGRRQSIIDDSESMNRNLQTANTNPTPQRNAVSPSKGTVVEYREKGNGAVIHKSFLPK